MQTLAEVPVTAELADVFLYARQARTHWAMSLAHARCGHAADAAQHERRALSMALAAGRAQPGAPMPAVLADVPTLAAQFCVAQMMVNVESAWAREPRALRRSVALH